LAGAVAVDCANISVVLASPTNQQSVFIVKTKPQGLEVIEKY